MLKNLNDKSAKNDKKKMKGVAEKVKKDVKFYSSKMWKGVKLIYKCGFCNYSSENEDDVILHVITHQKDSEKDTVLNMLLDIKEKRNG